MWVVGQQVAGSAQTDLGIGVGQQARQDLFSPCHGHFFKGAHGVEAQTVVQFRAIFQQQGDQVVGQSFELSAHVGDVRADLDVRVAEALGEKREDVVG